MSMSEDQLKAAAEFYGIDIAEAQRRQAVFLDRVEDPTDPICVGCARRPEEIPVYAAIGEDEGVAAKVYVIMNEGTFNSTNGHFLCDECYIKNGQPSSPSGWTCP